VAIILDILAAVDFHRIIRLRRAQAPRSGREDLKPVRSNPQR
jgi:hypothetical protein